MNKILTKLLLFFFLSWASQGAYSVVLNVDGSGQLLGASNINVGGTLFDVAFTGGSFNETFVDASGLDATTASQAILFSQALLDQVFLDTPQGNFDTSPMLTFGCHNTLLCIVFTPFEVLDNSFNSILAFNRVGTGLPDIVRTLPASSGGLGRDGSFFPTSTWILGDWSPTAQVEQVEQVEVFPNRAQ